MRLTLVLVAILGSAPAFPDAPALAVDGIAHVAFRVSDVAASRAFYSKLGFDQAFEFNDAAGTTAAYLKVSDRQFIELYRRGKADEPIGLMHVCFDVTAIDRLRETYVGQGLAPSKTTKARAGNLLFNLRDPENQVLEYTEYQPGSLHWNARGTAKNDRRLSQHLFASAVAVKDLAAERAYYVSKLGFEDLGGTESARLRAPGASGEQIELEPAGPDWKPHVVFIVPDLGRTVADLKGRSVPFQMRGSQAVVTDPDGNALIFTLEPAALAILGLERRALEGWFTGDPDPLLAMFDPEITYVHSAATTKRLDGIAAVRSLLESYRGTPLFDAFEIENPKVQLSGETGILTYRLIRHNGAAVSRWNATQVYHRNPEGWRVLHTHWSQAAQPQP